MNRIIKNKSSRKKNNKGMMSNVALAVIAIVTIIIFSMFMYKVYNNMKDKMSTQSCKSSIQAHSLVATMSASEIFTDIKCPTKEITIKDNKKAKKIIAEDMHRCYYVWGQGKGQYFKGDGNFCHICSIYKFTNDGEKIDGFVQYLATQPIQVKYSGDTPGISYQDYFQGYSTPNSADIISETVQDISYIDTIDTSEKYAAVFVYASGKDAISKTLEGGKRTTAITGLALFGLAGSAGASGAAGMATAAGTTTLVSTATGAPLSAAAFEALTAIGGGSSVVATTTAGTVLTVTPIGWMALGTGVLVLTGYGIYTLLDTPDPEWVAYIAFRPYNADELDALNCQKLEVNQMSNAARN